MLPHALIAQDRSDRRVAVLFQSSRAAIGVASKFMLMVGAQGYKASTDSTVSLPGLVGARGWLVCLSGHESVSSVAALFGYCPSLSGMSLGNNSICSPLLSANVVRVHSSA